MNREELENLVYPSKTDRLLSPKNFQNKSVPFIIETYGKRILELYRPFLHWMSWGNSSIRFDN